MAGDKLNTAEHDSKGRCVRHPDIRLRKKKLLGGWKIIIGHCPECCLDEMRRVRDQIEGKDDNDSDHRGGTSAGGGGFESKKSSGSKPGKKDKKSSRGDKERKSKKSSKSGSRSSSNRHRDDDDISGVESEGYNSRRVRDTERGSRSSNRRKGDGESDATGSTSQMTEEHSFSGSGSVVSEQYHRPNGGYAPGYFPPPVKAPVERTMVLSMAFTDQQTGQSGTYTGQVNSMTHKPDGKGTVYYNNGSIEEGTWENGVLVGDANDSHPNHGGGNMGGGSGMGGRDHSRGNSRYGRSSSDELPELNPERAGGRSASRSGAMRRQEPPAMNHGHGGNMGHPQDNSPPRSMVNNGGMMMGGNLDRLESLGGNRRRTRGAAASVQSYNSRASRGSQFGSQTVVGSQSVAGYGMGGGGGIYHGADHHGGGYYDNGGGRSRDPMPSSRYHHGMRATHGSKRGSYEG